MRFQGDDIREKEEDLESLRVAYLRERGWEHRCNFPDSCWRWVKEFAGVVVTESLCGAVALQMHDEE